MKHRALVVLLALLPAAQVLANDALLDEALARPGQPKGAVSGFIVNTNTLTGGSEPEVEHETIDLSKKPDEGYGSYDQLKDVIGTKAERVATTDGRMLYKFRTHRVPSGKSTPKGVKIDDSDDFDFDGTAEVLRDAQQRPYVGQIKLHMRHASGPLIGRLKTMDLAFGYAPSTDGAVMHAVNIWADVTVRALFFIHREFTLDSRWSPTNTAIAEASAKE
ncbi:hypothetical protein L2Y96_03405 [Luteibacter aegosomaticola]|uniref:hypothetical protein n=1 Tax=Luteibacter aegosomaticola TaxID=2911538 RepID=UPI001FF7BF66|nr:hypothetical protein [Luteibacter aegosomaticola]UPG90834.1 hypothetical protein L2Y96_03405 [Luteibacter aegosomaticola]